MVAWCYLPGDKACYQNLAMDIAEYATSQRSCMVGSQHLHKFAKQSMSTPL